MERNAGLAIFLALGLLLAGVGVSVWLLYRTGERTPAAVAAGAPAVPSAAAVAPAAQAHATPSSASVATVPPFKASQGPFPVTNCATGKTDSLGRSANGKLALWNAKGIRAWSIALPDSLRGRVENIDFFRNGKIQFLFCAGASLCMVDRLGRWVKGFPLSLPRPVKLGPALYDIASLGGYTVMVCHADNTLELYDLKGNRAKGWQGISLPFAHPVLPRLTGSGERLRWRVETPDGAVWVYPLEGGQPLPGQPASGNE